MKEINSLKHGLYRFKDFTDFNSYSLWQLNTEIICAIRVTKKPMLSKNPCHQKIRVTCAIK